jgi:hypothetical protein
MVSSVPLADAGAALGLAGASDLAPCGEAPAGCSRLGGEAVELLPP